MTVYQVRKFLNGFQEYVEDSTSKFVRSILSTNFNMSKLREKIWPKLLTIKQKAHNNVCIDKCHIVFLEQV